MAVGAFELVGGAWHRTDLWESQGDAPVAILEGWELVNGQWEPVYQREVQTAITVTSAPIVDQIAGVTTHPDLTGLVLDIRDDPVDEGTITVELVDVVTAATVATDTTPVNADGTFTWTPAGPIADPGTYYYRLSYSGPEQFLPSQNTDMPFDVAAATVALAFTTQPSGSVTSGVTTLGTITGSVARVADGEPVAGTVDVSLVNDDGSISALGTAMVIADGSWSYAHGAVLNLLGARQIRAVFNPSGVEESTSKLGNILNVELASPGTLVKGSVTVTSVSMSYSEVPNRTDFQVYRNGAAFSASSGTSYTNTGSISPYTQYKYKIRARATTPSGLTVYGPFTTEHTARTGRNEVRDNSSARFWIRCVATGSWRTASNNVWGQRGDKILQGAYSGYQSYGYYRGLIDFGHQGAYNQALSAVGGVSARISNGSASEAIVHLYKNSGVGTSGGIILRWCATNMAAGNDPGSVTGGAWHDVATGGANSWGAYSFGLTNANTLIKSKWRGIACIYDSTASDRYGEFNGRSAGADDCDIIVTWNWNYVTTSAASGVWLT